MFAIYDAPQYDCRNISGIGVGAEGMGKISPLTAVTIGDYPLTFGGYALHFTLNNKVN